MRQVDYAHRGYTDTFLCTVVCDWRKPETETTFSLMCVWFFPTVSEDVVQMPSYVLHLVLVSLAGARGGVVVIHQGFGIGSFWEWEGFCNTSELTVRAGVQCKGL